MPTKNSSDLGNLEQGPKQPILKCFPVSKSGSQNRAFSSKHYAEFNWLEYSVERDAVFCFVCRMFDNNLHENIFTVEGFRKWEKLKEKLIKHSQTVAHKNNTEKYLAYKTTTKQGTVVSHVTTAHRELVLKIENFSTLSPILLSLYRVKELHFEDMIKLLVQTTRVIFKKFVL